MNWFLWVLALFVVIGIGTWLVSFVAEALRPKPKTPAKLRWAPDIPIQSVEIGGNKVRYIKTGKGPVLVLLHTLRTQLDLFEKVVPELSKRFTVYALDYPGHGYSDIPEARYDAGFFADAVEGFLDKLDLRDVTLAGVSIGGSIALILASRRNPRVARIIAINPYDYAKGRGMARSSIFGRFITYASLLPIIGETVMRLRNSLIMRQVLNRRRSRREEHPARAFAGDVCRRQSARPLPRLPEPAPQLTELGGSDQRLWPHSDTRAARLGRPGLGQAVRARA